MDPYETMNGKTNTSQEESLLCWVEIFRILRIFLTLVKIYTRKIILLSSFAMVGFTARRLPYPVPPGTRGCAVPSQKSATLLPSFSFPVTMSSHTYPRDWSRELIHLATP